jgi:hypothetical protein
MKMKWLLLGWLAGLPALGAENFPPTTLHAFEARHPSDGPGYQFATPLEPLSIQASFSGKFRPLSPAVQAFLQAYTRSLGDSLNNAAGLSLYREEVLVNEIGSGQPIWLPIPPAVAQALRKEIKPNGAMKLQLRYFGLKDKEAIYAMIDYTPFDDGAVGSIPTNGPELKTWAEVCQLTHCTVTGGQLLNPPLSVYLAGKFTGKTRPVSSNFTAHLKAFTKKFPDTFQIPVAKVLATFNEEAQIVESGSGKIYWIPLQKTDRERLTKTSAASTSRVLTGIYGTQNGQLYLMGIEIETAPQP